MRDSIGEHENWEKLLMLGPSEALNLEFPENHFDLAFIDGHVASRPECVNKCFGLVPIIVAHDYECPVYGWDRVKIPDDYAKKIHHTGDLQTVIFIKRSLL